MHTLKSTLVVIMSVAAWLGVGPMRLAADTWPQGSVRFIVPLGPGSAADIGARLVADRLAARWGKPVVVENRPGGDAVIGIAAFVSANDDHTLLFAPSGTFTIQPFVHEKLPYDATRWPSPIAHAHRSGPRLRRSAKPVSRNSRWTDSSGCSVRAAWQANGASASQPTSPTSPMILPSRPGSLLPAKSSISARRRHSPPRSRSSAPKRPPSPPSASSRDDEAAGPLPAAEERPLRQRAFDVHRRIDLLADPRELRSNKADRVHWIEQREHCEKSYQQHQLRHGSLRLRSPGHAHRRYASAYHRPAGMKLTLPRVVQFKTTWRKHCAENVATLHQRCRQFE